jgi:hypothetical protein
MRAGGSGPQTDDLQILQAFLRPSTALPVATESLCEALDLARMAEDQARQRVTRRRTQLAKPWSTYAETSTCVRQWAHETPTTAHVSYLPPSLLKSPWPRPAPLPTHTRGTPKPPMVWSRPLLTGVSVLRERVEGVRTECIAP